MKPRYYVKTWDANKEEFTPQKGVRCGPYSLFGLRKALRELNCMGYDTKRDTAHSILVYKEEAKP